MKEWIVYVDGVEVHRYRHTEQLTFEQWPTAVQVEVVAPPAPPPEPGPARHITKLAFRNRFTATEKATIELASIHQQSLAVDHPSNQLAAALRASQQDLAVAQYIDLDRTDTRNGVLALQQYGLIAAGRALQILDAPITDVERFNA